MKLWTVVTLSLILVGCGSGRPKMVPVEGLVTLDGEPVENAFVVFQVVEVQGDYRRPSKGMTDAQGRFKVGTFSAEDGLPIGKYKVGIQKRELVSKLPENYNAEAPQAQPIRYRLLIPMMYENPDESGLTAEVTADGLVPEKFELESGGTPEIVTEGGSGGGA